MLGLIRVVTCTHVCTLHCLLYIRLDLNIFQLKIFLKKLLVGEYPCGYSLDIWLIPNPLATYYEFQFIILNSPTTIKLPTTSGFGWICRFADTIVILNNVIICLKI